jgi:hypothetical protein
VALVALQYPLLLLSPLTRSDDGHRRALDQPLATAGLRAELLEWRFSREPRIGAYRGGRAMIDHADRYIFVIPWIVSADVQATRRRPMD